MERVVDGDTAVVNIEKSLRNEIEKKLNISIDEQVTIRFIGIDTPESTKEKQLFGLESKEYTAALLSKGNVEIELDDKVLFDKYGRLVVHVFVQGQSVQEMLLEAGLARVAYIFDEYKYLDVYRAAEERAKKQNLNIWSIPDYVTSRGYDMTKVNKDMEPNEMEIEEINMEDISNIVDSIISTVKKEVQASE